MQNQTVVGAIGPRHAIAITGNLLRVIGVECQESCPDTLGVFDVVVRSVNDWSNNDSSLIAQAAELMNFTIQQHLNIAWSRMATDLKKDVALISVDEGKWKSRGKQIAAGRTVSRLEQAIGWMEQLGWIDENGITSTGRPYADRAYEIAGRADQ